MIKLSAVRLSHIGRVGKPHEFHLTARKRVLELDRNRLDGFKLNCFNVFSVFGRGFKMTYVFELIFKS